MSSILTGIAAGLAVVYLFGYCYRGVSWPKTGVKTASILLLALAALGAGGPILLVWALGCCALGDFLLSREDERSFLLGVGAFATGHILYIWLFFSHELADFDRLMTAPRFYLLGGMVVFAGVMARILLPRAGELKGAVLGYIPIIAGMGVAVLVLPLEGMFEYLLVGALLFVLSDFVLALEMFVLPETASARRYTPFVVWVTYWSAQYLLFASLS